MQTKCLQLGCLPSVSESDAIGLQAPARFVVFDLSHEYGQPFPVECQLFVFSEWCYFAHVSAPEITKSEGRGSAGAS